MFGLSLLSPAFLAAAAGAAVPIALHLFHRRVEPVVSFPALRFLRRAPVEQARHRRVRERVLLALRVAACVLLAVAFSRPFISSIGAAAGPLTVVALDTSFSLGAPGQVERARRLAREAIRGVSEDQQVALVTFSDRADVAAPPSGDRAPALAAVERAAAGFGATRYRAALARAVGLIASRPGRIIVVTDLQRGGWDAQADGGVPARIAVEVRDVGPPAGNLAVLSLRRDAIGAVAVVRNFGAGTRTDAVRFSVGRRTLFSSPVVVPGEGVADVRADVPFPASGVLAAAVSDPTGYAADNVRYLALDAEAALKVLAITASGRLDPDAFYLQRAVEAADGAPVTLTAIAGSRLWTVDAAALQRYGAVLVLGTREMDHRGRALLAGYVRGGGGLLVAAGPDVDPDSVADALGAPALPGDWRGQGATGAGGRSARALTPVDARHPIFAPFATVPGSLSRVRFERVASVDAGRDGRVLARYDDGLPAMVEWTVGRGRAVLFASDLNNAGNDFPLQPAFVPFVHESIRYLAAHSSTGADDVLVGDVPAGVPPRPGGVTLPARPGGQPRHLVVNVDVRESDPTPTGADGFLAAITRLRAEAVEQQRVDQQAREQDQRLWEVALAAVLAALIGESALGRRMA